VTTDKLTDASDFMICPMLCYSNGTDNDMYFCTIHIRYW